MNINFAGVDPASIRRIQILSTYKFQLSDILNVQMIGMLQAVVETPIGAGKVIINGELNFEQDEAILIDNV